MSNNTMQVCFTNLTGGNAIIYLHHYNSSFTDENTWDAIANNEQTSYMTINFTTGFLDKETDWWSASVTVLDGPNAGKYTTTSPKEEMLMSSDSGTQQTFFISTSTFSINLNSGGGSQSMELVSSSEGITNVFVLMLENHSFDNIFAMSGIQGITAATTSNSNSYNGTTYAVSNTALATMPTDPGHEFLDVVEQLAGSGATYPSGGPYPTVNNSGFASNYATSVTEDTGTPAATQIGDIMACFDTPTQLPVICQLATEFAICDHWFSSMPGPTWPNRFFVHGASSNGLDDSPSNWDLSVWEGIDGFSYQNKSIFDVLQIAYISNGVRLYSDRSNSYSDEPQKGDWSGGIAQVAAISGITMLPNIAFPFVSVNDLASFADDLLTSYPYKYTFIEPNYGAAASNTYWGGSSQHPMDDTYGGEALIKMVYDAIRKSPIWNTSLLIITYDEHGGFYDSVTPPSCTPPNDGSSTTPGATGSLSTHGFNFEQYGPRVPAVIVSPLIPKGTVDSTVYDHSSVIATVRGLFNITQPLTDRDKYANDVRHLLSLPTARTDCPPALNSPVSSAIKTQLTSVEQADIDQQPLPKSGNIHGFLHIMRKTEFELSSGSDADKTRILENSKNIKTRGDAKAYINSVMKKVADARINSK